MPPRAALRYKTAMEKQNWRKVYAYSGLAVIGFALAYYATAVATSGIAAGLLGRQEAGRDLLSTGSAVLLVGVATMAIFGYLALRLGWTLTRRPR